jgi:hypothetical protein
MFLVVAIGCQPVTEVETGPISSPSSTPIQQSTASPAPLAFQTNQAEVVTSVPSQTPLPQAASENPATNESGIPWEGDQMPIFLEVIQTTSMGKNVVQSPAIRVGPAIYFYKLDNKVLMLHPTIMLESKTQVLVGVTTILQTPGQVFENREIIQYPSAQPFLIQIAAYDVATDTLTIFYGDEKFELAPGEKRTFKQLGAGSNSSTKITIISNHGQLAEIQPTLSDGSVR